MHLFQGIAAAECAGTRKAVTGNFGRDKKILRERRRIKEKTLKERCRNYIIRKLELNYERI
jgi:hypothetical protein